MKLEIALLTGPETKQFLSDLTKQIDRLEALKNVDSDPTNDQKHAEAFEEEVPQKAAKKAKKEKVIEETFDLDDESEKEEPAEELEDKEEEISLNDILEGFKEYAKAKGRDKAVAILTKLKVKSVKDIPPEKFKKVLEALKK